MVQLGYRAWADDVARVAATRDSLAAGPLEHEPSLLFVTFSLAALAIENLLKANLIKKHPGYIRDGKFRGDVIGSHSLLDIASDAGITLSDDEHDFCELGFEAIMSFGRYHLSKNFTDTPREVSVKNSAFPIYEQFYKRLRTQALPGTLPVP